MTSGWELASWLGFLSHHHGDSAWLPPTWIRARRFVGGTKFTWDFTPPTFFPRFSTTDAHGRPHHTPSNRETDPDIPGIPDAEKAIPDQFRAFTQ